MNGHTVSVYQKSSWFAFTVALHDVGLRIANLGLSIADPTYSYMTWAQHCRP